MNKDLQDLQDFAHNAQKSGLPVIAKRIFIMLFAGFPAGVLLLYPPVFGMTGWGILGGIAGLFMSLTAVVAGIEIHFLVKGV